MKYRILPAALACAALFACSPAQGGGASMASSAAPAPPPYAAESPAASEEPFSSEVRLLKPKQEAAPSEAPKAFSIEMPASADQGETVVIRAENARGMALSAETGLNFTPRFFDAGDGSRIALLPVRYTAQPGEYAVTIRAGDKVLHKTLQVTEREFEIQQLTMDPGTAGETALSAAANAEWEQKIEPLKLVSDPEQYWENPFLQPAHGPITTEFGCIRYTNGGSVPSRHGGIDIAADRGDPVLAANNGRVLFADRIQLTGNMAVIEHGYGLKSFYYHMDGLNVKAGDMVKKGDQIGIVGSTGYSTGPHLHFAMAVNNVFVNPWTAFDPGI